MIKLKNISSYLNEIKLEQLDNNGISCWEFYDEAISNYMDMCGIEDEDDMDVDDILNALDTGGMRDWDFYDDSLSDYFDYEEYVEKERKLGAVKVLGFYEWKK